MDLRADRHRDFLHLQTFDIYTNPRGTFSCQGKVSYRGPVATRDLPRIKLDLTADERIVLAPVRVPVFHPYSEAPAEGIKVLAYAYEELFGEKTRAAIFRRLRSGIPSASAGSDRPLSFEACRFRRSAGP